MVDLDGVMADYYGAFKRDHKSDLPYPQSKIGFFSNLKPIEGALESFEKLSTKYDMWILSAPSYMNPSSYSEKRIWVEKYLGLEMCKKLILSYDKSMVLGDYLIDDTKTKKQLEFTGEFIHFGSEKYPNWDAVLKYLL